MTAVFLPVLALIAVLGAVMGFRDAPNSLALAVRFRALAPRVALLLAALLNGLGTALGMALAGAGVSLLVAAGHSAQVGLGAVVVAILVAIGWGLLLWWRRMPVSTTHALLAAIVGAHGAAHLLLGTSLWAEVDARLWAEVLLGLLLSPLLAWGLTRLVTPAVVRLGTRGTTVTVQHRARVALAISTATAALGHGVQTGQRLGVLWTLAATSAGVLAVPDPGALLRPALTAGADPGPSWLFWSATAVFAVAAAVGTLGGAWRVAWTLTERLVSLDPLRAAVAAAVPAGLLFLGSLAFGVPLSSTHTVTAGIVGAGQTQTFASVRWPQVLCVVAWWILTPLACGGVALLAGLALLPLAL